MSLLRAYFPSGSRRVVNNSNTQISGCGRASPISLDHRRLGRTRNALKPPTSCWGYLLQMDTPISSRPARLLLGEIKHSLVGLSEGLWENKSWSVNETAWFPLGNPSPAWTGR